MQKASEWWSNIQDRFWYAKSIGLCTSSSCNTSSWICRRSTFWRKHKFDQGKSGKLLEYFENTYIGKETKSFRKPPMFPLEMWNVCDEILNNEPTTNNQTERWFRSFTADQPGIQTAGKSFLGLRREDTLAKLLFKELKNKTYSDPKTVQSARILERNVRFKLIVNSFDLCNTNYLMQIINN